MAETDSAGTLAQTHHQDAFGNTQASWSTGLWGGDKPGWHHNTKEYDADIGLVYMYSRYYNAETGTFASRAPYPPTVEPPFGFASMDPASTFDSYGRIVTGGTAAQRAAVLKSLAAACAELGSNTISFQVAFAEIFHDVGRQDSKTAARHARETACCLQRKCAKPPDFIIEPVWHTNCNEKGYAGWSDKSRPNVIHVCENSIGVGGAASPSLQNLVMHEMSHGCMYYYRYGYEEKLADAIGNLWGEQ